MEFTEQNLSGYLSHKLGTDIKVESLSKFPRGSSRETRFLTYRRGDNKRSVDIVLRSDLPSGSVDPTPLDQEFFIYDRLSLTAIPAAKALWWEDDPQWTDRPFYAREKIAGDWNIANFSNQDPAYDQFRIGIAKEHLAKLALIHQADWRALGFEQYLAVPANEADAAHCYVNTLLVQYQQLAKEGIAIVLEACEWLHDNAPVAPCLSLCKGTNGYGEEVFRDGKLVAFSDWEEASIGDPAADFAFMQDFIFDLQRDGKTVWNLSIALDYYFELSGIRISPQSVGYYQVIRALRLLIMSHNSAVSVVNNSDAFIRQAWTCTEVLHLAKRVLTTAMGLLPPITAERFAQLNESIDMQ